MFGNALRQWFEQHKSYLNELGYSEDGKKQWHTHKRLRSAYNSLKRNLPYLFTFEQNRESMIPNTANRLEGKFGELKNKIRCHAGSNTELLSDAQPENGCRQGVAAVGTEFRIQHPKQLSGCF